MSIEETIVENSENEQMIDEQNPVGQEHQEQDSNAENKQQKKPSAIPLSRFNEVVRKRHDAERELARARAENAALLKILNPGANLEADTEQQSKSAKQETPQVDVETLVDQALLRKEQNKAWKKQEELARGKYDDYDDTVASLDVEFPDDVMTAIRETIVDSDVGSDISYYLGKNPKIAEEISKMSPFKAARQIGIIETSLKSQIKKQSSAPEPIKPTKSMSQGKINLSDLTGDAYVEEMNKREREARKRG